MHTLEVDVTIRGREIKVESPEPLPEGRYRARITLDDASAEKMPTRRSGADYLLKPIDIDGEWPAGFTMRREEIYGEDGR